MAPNSHLSHEQARVVVDEWLAAFEAALADNDAASAAELFLEDGFLRDLLALTWDLRTYQGRVAIAEALKDAIAARSVAQLRQADGPPEVFERRRFGETIEAFFTFATDVGSCRAYLRLRRSPSSSYPWRAWTVATSLDQLSGYPERAGAQRPTLPADSHSHGQRPTAEEVDVAGQAVEPEVVIIGAGQAGLSLAARLAALEVPTLIVEREPRVGDNWRHRYQSLVLHNQVWANHMPYLPFPSSWPTYLSKDHIADWLEHYSEILELPVKTSTRVLSGRYEPADQRWTLAVAGPDGVQIDLHPRQVVLATGVFGVPNRTEIPGSDKFAGTLLHVTDYRGDEALSGARVLVVGSGSSAHDAAQHLALSGGRVTMLQRSSTCVVSVDPGAARAYSIYKEDGAPIEDCDLITNSFPFPLLADLHRDMTQRISELDSDLLAGLRNAGFALDFGEDGSGFLMKYHRSGGGYYINVGASDLIIDGTIKVKQGVEIADINGHSVRYTDGTSADFDVILVATGYQNMSESVRLVLGDAVADRVGPIWGLDDEGEPRAMWKRTNQPGFWVCGGSLQQCRPYSKYLALQIKAEQVGLLN